MAIHPERYSITYAMIGNVVVGKHLTIFQLEKTLVIEIQTPTYTHITDHGNSDYWPLITDYGQLQLTLNDLHYDQ